jgi:hypothetical protein
MFEEPTAMQFDALAHDTESNALGGVPAGRGTGTADHVLPFHCSANDRNEEPLPCDPTTMHRVALGHATESSMMPFPVTALAFDHVEPLSFSAIGW